MGIGEVALLLFAGAGGLALVELVTRRTDAGALVVLGMLLFGIAFSEVETSVTVGPVNVGLGDLLFLIFMTAATARLLRSDRLTFPHRLLIALGLLVVFSIVQGVGLHGAAAGNEARPFLRFIGVALYFSTAEPRRDLFNRIGGFWLAVSVTLSILAVVRWGALAAGVNSGVLASSTGTVRVLPSGQTLIIAVGAVLALPLLADRERGLIRFLGPAMLVVVVLLQHRSVWVVAAAGTVYLLFRKRAVAKQALTALAAGVIIFGVLVSTVFYQGDEDVTEQLSGATQQTGTWDWRVAGWVALLTDSGPEGPLELAVGKPFGEGWDRQLEPRGRVISVSPHNHYVSTYLRLGVLGLLGTLLIYSFALRGTHKAARARVPDYGLLDPDFLNVVLGMQLLYYIPYSVDIYQAMLLGLACAMASSSATSGQESDRPRLAMAK